MQKCRTQDKKNNILDGILVQVCTSFITVNAEMLMCVFVSDHGIKEWRVCVRAIMCASYSVNGVIA